MSSRYTGNIHIAVLMWPSRVLPMTAMWNWRGRNRMAIIESQVRAAQSPYENAGSPPSMRAYSGRWAARLKMSAKPPKTP